MDITGRTAVVTGAAIGTGRATAIALAERGAEVVAVDLDEPGGRETVRRAGPDRCRFVRADLTDAEQTADLIRTSRPGILVNNAGGGGHLPPHFPEASPAEWERLLTLNLIGPMRATQHALEAMRDDGGVVVNIASVAGLGLGRHPSPEYSAAKAGLIRFTATLADVAPARVVCLVPDWVATERVTEAERATEPPPIPLSEFAGGGVAADRGRLTRRPGHAAAAGGGATVADVTGARQARLSARGLSVTVSWGRRAGSGATRPPGSAAIEPEAGARPMTDSTPLLLVDGHNLLWRAWYGFPARIHSRDKTRDLTGVFGFLALLRVAIRELPDPPEVIVVFDGEDAWGDRTAVDADYKAHRPTDEEAMAPIRSLADVQRGLAAVGLRQVCLDTAEADDVIATLVRRCRRSTPGRDVWIMSSDRDFYQLLDRRTRILNTARHPGRRVIEAAEVETRFGVQPVQWCDRTSLVGDPSDGIRGIRGVGTITAARLLAGGLTLDRLAAAGRLTGRIGVRVESALGDARRWRSMITLRSDLPLPRRLITRRPSAPLPLAAMIIETLGLW